MKEEKGGKRWRCVNVIQAIYTCSCEAGDAAGAARVTRGMYSRRQKSLTTSLCAPLTDSVNVTEAMFDILFQTRFSGKSP